MKPIEVFTCDDWLAGRPTWMAPDDPGLPFVDAWMAEQVLERCTRTWIGSFLRALVLAS